MDIVELIERAKEAAGSQLAVAEKIGRPHSRISEWKAGRRKPDAADIMLLAETAELPPLETLAEIECQLDEERASVWKRALGNLRAAGVAAGVVLGVGAVTLAGVTPEKAQAAEKEKNQVARPAGIEPATPAFGGQYSIH
jgi:transcriptional regulator with XRE-family HTH domain